MSFFHGVTVTNVDIGARTIALPASSVIGRHRWYQCRR